MSSYWSPLQSAKGQESGGISGLFVPSQGMTGIVSVTMHHYKDMSTEHVSVLQLLQQKSQANPESLLSQDF